MEHDIDPGPVTHCQVCGSGNLELVIDLGHQPLCDSLLTEEQLRQPETSYPLRQLRCPECTLNLLDYVVPGDVVYHQEYPYKSGVTRELVAYMDAMSATLAERHSLPPDSLVVDIGSNDGTLLGGFKRRGHRVVGVEPTQIAELAQQDGIDTVHAFFSTDIARRIVEDHGNASLVTATNVFAHMSQLGETVRGIEMLIGDKGIAVIEVHYLLDVLLRRQFDTIYHEHIRTYSLRSLITLVEQYGLEVMDAERANRYGGNIRIHVARRGVYPVHGNVAQLLRAEADAGLGDAAVYDAFRSDVERNRVRTMEFLYQCAARGERVVGNSSPGRASTLINYYGIDQSLVPYLAEQPASLKRGLYLPGMHIPIVDNSILVEEQPDYIVLFAWHYADSITAELRQRGIRSRLVEPLPAFRIDDGMDA